MQLRKETAPHRLSNSATDPSVIDYPQKTDRSLPPPKNHPILQLRCAGPASCAQDIADHQRRPSVVRGGTELGLRHALDLLTLLANQVPAVITRKRAGFERVVDVESASYGPDTCCPIVVLETDLGASEEAASPRYRPGPRLVRVTKTSMTRSPHVMAA